MQILLIVLAVIFLFFGTVYLIEPMRLASQAGILADASGHTDIRATYGGFQIGFAVFLAWCAAAKHRQSTGVLAVALILGSVGLCRMIGVAVDGAFSGFNQIGLCFEIFVCLFSIILLRRNQTS